MKFPSDLVLRLRRLLPQRFQSESQSRGALQTETQNFEGMRQLRLGLSNLTRDVVESSVENVLSATLDAFPMELEKSYSELQVILFAAGRGDAFFDLLVSVPPQTFTRIQLLAQIIDTAQALGRGPEIFAAIEKVKADPNFPAVQWSVTDQIRPMSRILGEEAARELIALKYKGIPSKLTTPTELFRSADILQDQVEIPKNLLDRLYRIARSKEGIQRPAWEADVRSAFCIDHLTKDRLPQHISNPDVWLADTRELLNSSLEKRAGNEQGTLFVSFNGGFPRLNASLYQSVFKDGIVLSAVRGAEQQRTLRTVKGLVPNRAIRILRGGGSLWFTPDVTTRRNTSKLRVLGTEIAVSEAATQLAYKTNCRTVWLSFVRKEGTFVPWLVEGPRKRLEEDYPSFRTRWLKFYARRIEDRVRGDSQSLALRPIWVSYLTERKVRRRSEDEGLPRA